MSGRNLHATLLGALLLLAADAPASPAERLPLWTVAQASPDRYVSVHGLRAFVGGYPEDGLEIWTFPLQLVSGYAVDVVRRDETSMPATALPTSVTVDPLRLTRTHDGPGFRLHERIETRGKLPGARIRFRIEGGDGLRLRIRFRPSLDLMWPAAIGGQAFAWDAAARGFLLSEPSRRFRALVSSPQAGAHTQPNNDRRGSAFTREIDLALDPVRCGADRCATLVFAGQAATDEDVHATAVSLLRAPDAPEAADVARFDPSRTIAITTPDADANRAIRWAQVALEQAWTCNPRLGCGLVAGYGPSHGARRPQYAWYFAGDGLVSTRALLHEGAHARAAEELAFIYRHQQPHTGMIWHEISQSAPFLDWARDYPYMYVHVDITFDFLAVLAEYDRATGDQAFLERHWPQTLLAWRYCLSTLDADDGLPRIPADKMAGNEQDRLGDELTLSAAWVEAAHAMSRLAASMHDPALARQAEAASVRARASLRSRYRDVRAQRWISGFTRAGRAGESTSAADLAAIAAGAATPEEAAATLDRLATPAYLTAWGLRSTPATARDYDPEAYAKGSVWGLGTAAAAEALWRAGRPAAANALWQRLVPWAAQDSPGHMHEVMSGTRFAPQRESVPEQTWSSTAFLSAAIHGMLGLDADARANTLRFAPRPPASWPFVRVERVRIGASVADLDWRIEDGRQALEVRSAGPAFRLAWDTGAGIVEREIAAGRTRLQSP